MEISTSYQKKKKKKKKKKKRKTKQAHLYAALKRLSSKGTQRLKVK